MNSRKDNNNWEISLTNPRFRNGLIIIVAGVIAVIIGLSFGKEIPNSFFIFFGGLVLMFAGLASWFVPVRIGGI